MEEGNKIIVGKHINDITLNDLEYLYFLKFIEINSVGKEVSRS
jgi:hypothetical protein